MADFRLRKAERLTKRKAIEYLFTNGASVKAFPLRIIYVTPAQETPFPAQVAVTVPKKLFKRANQRNALKRKLREAYRLNKHVLYDQLTGSAEQISLMIIYTSPEVQTFDRIEKALVKAMHIMLDKITA